MDRSKPNAAPPSPAPVPPHRPRRRQFTIFGLMVLMFVVSIGFSQLYYWSRAQQHWDRQERQRIEQEKQAAQAEKDATANAGKPASQQKPAPATSPQPPPNANTSDAPIAILMAVALPMLVMIIASIAYNIRRELRRRRR